MYFEKANIYIDIHTQKNFKAGFTNTVSSDQVPVRAPWRQMSARAAALAGVEGALESMRP